MQMVHTIAKSIVCNLLGFLRRYTVDVKRHRKLKKQVTDLCLILI